MNESSAAPFCVLERLTAKLTFVLCDGYFVVQYMMWSMMMWSLFWAFFMAALVVTLYSEHPSVSNRATTQLHTYTLYQRKISAEWCHSIDPLLLLALTAIDASVLPRFVPE